MFEKTLSDLVKGIRSNKRRENEFIAKCVQEIKEELSSKDKSHAIKATAILKLTYLQMLGYDMGWASFHVVEVMSSPGFAQKRLGYLGASVSFHDETEVVLLTTNMFKKDFQSSNPYEVGLAINCLANICTPDLARDLVADVVTLINSNRPYVRKKSVLVMYKIFLKFPDALRPSFPKLKEKLEDRDSSAVSCAVNVICELARKNPQNYLALAPLFFKLLTHTSNNWMLIKIVKLLGALCPLEPRLGKKLVEPLSNLISTTPAKSLLYEAIHTVSVGMTPHLQIVQLSMEKLKGFVEDEDQNLKYLGLLAMGNFMKVHPRIVAEHKTMILKCLNDEDITIRHRALDLVNGMVTKKNLMDICRILMEHVTTAEGSFRSNLVEKIIEICSANGYSSVTNFEWYIATLCKLARMPGVTNGDQIRQQLMDVVIRVKVVRQYGVKMMVDILRDNDMFAQSSRDPRSAEVMYAAAWLVGEFSGFVDEGQHKPVLEALLNQRVTSLPEHVQSVYLQNALKVYVSAYGSSSGMQPESVDLMSDGTKGDQDLLSMADTASETPAVPGTQGPTQTPGDPMDALMGSGGAVTPSPATSVPAPNPSDDLDMLLGPDIPPAANPAPAEVPAGASSGAPADEELLGNLHVLFEEKLPVFEKSTLLEVQERACICSQILQISREGQAANLHPQLQALFADELNPVAPKAQGKVPVPEGLDLDERFYDEVEEEEEEEEEEEIEDEEEVEEKKPKKKKKKESWDDESFSSSDRFAVKPSKKEMKKMQKEAEKEKKRRTQDPFYLGAKKQDDTVMLEAEEVENIPVFRLSDDEGEKKKKKKKKKKYSSDEEEDEDIPPPSPADSAPSFTVDMGYEMPDGGDDEDEEGETDDKDELAARLNVDISKPLKSSEVLPTIKSYERKSRYEVEEEERRKKKKDKKDKKKDKKKKGDDDEGDDGEADPGPEDEEPKKEKKKKDKSKSKGEEVADLLDMGDGEASTAKEEKQKANGDDLAMFFDTPNSSGKVEDLDDLLDSGDKKEKKKKKKVEETKEDEEDEEEVEKPDKKSKKDKKEKKDKSDKKKRQQEEDESEEEEDKKSKKKDKDSKKSKSDKKEKEGKSSKKDRESSAAPPKIKQRTLGGDSYIKATYEARAAADSSAKVPPVVVTVTVKNAGDCVLQPVSLHVTASMNVRLTSPPQDISSLKPGASADIRMELTVSSVSKPQKVKCAVKYEAIGEGAPAAPVSLQCELLLPCSAFLLAKEIPFEEFNGILANNECTHTSSTVIEAGGRSFKTWVQLLSLLLNLKLIHGLDGAASLYAVSVSGHHVCALVKAKSGGNMISVDMRCSEEPLCQQLCNEVSGLPLFIA